MGEFKHISVTAADDDEVIVVGAPDEGQRQPDAVQAGSSERDAEPSAPTGEPRALDRARAADSSASAQASGEDAPASEPASARRAPAAADASPQDERDARSSQVRGRERAGGSYRETTLEDLEPTPMPTAQKAVIIAAVVLLVVGVLYYLLVLA